MAERICIYFFIKGAIHQEATANTPPTAATLKTSLQNNDQNLPLNSGATNS